MEKNRGRILKITAIFSAVILLTSLFGFLIPTMISQNSKNNIEGSPLFAAALVPPSGPILVTNDDGEIINRAVCTDPRYRDIPLNIASYVDRNSYPFSTAGDAYEAALCQIESIRTMSDAEFDTLHTDTVTALSNSGFTQAATILSAPLIGGAISCILTWCFLLYSGYIGLQVLSGIWAGFHEVFPLLTEELTAAAIWLILVWIAQHPEEALQIFGAIATIILSFFQTVSAAFNPISANAQQQSAIQTAVTMVFTNSIPQSTMDTVFNT